ncbi:alpha/beta hydrolase [Mumia zhuanghuii]|uniref:Alpha/beta fold hydrolase n=2 Tax=Mumia TaxID=1546255 RepID=A0ABW1QGX5_9ACTN|nr:MULTISPECIES: alpha/beta hydrolase [Mumia]KAA1422865.1 alpha/beta hydrolase [Mumia zhuanghuii]
MTETQTHRLVVPTAELAYDVRANPDSTEPPLLVFGSPMAASGFGTLAGRFADRTVVTYDPRGAERSVRTDGASETTPEEHADDLHRLIEKLGGGPVDVFATSGGAINAFALVAQHPDDVRTLVAHEPPVAAVVPDAAQALAAVQGIRRLYGSEGAGPAMVKFILLVMHQGPVPEGFVEAPAPDPSAFGLSAEDDGSRDDVLLGQNLVTCTHYEPDFEALRAAQTRVVVVVGEGSEGQLASRAGKVVAERIGSEAVVFPGDHGGFMGGEHGQTGEPEAFAKALRQVLDGQG